MLIADYSTHNVGIGPAIDRLSPYKGTLSGERESEKPAYKYGPPSSKFPILALEDDIVMSSGRGLRKGFYEVRISGNRNFLYFVQSGNLKAKIPVIKLEKIPNRQKKEINYSNFTPKQAQKEMKKALKKQKKEYKKYIRGENPNNINYNNVKIVIDPVTQARIITLEVDDIRAVGVIQIQ